MPKTEYFRGCFFVNPAFSIKSIFLEFRMLKTIILPESLSVLNNSKIPVSDRRLLPWFLLLNGSF